LKSLIGAILDPFHRYFKVEKVYFSKLLVVALEDTKNLGEIPEGTLLYIYYFPQDSFRTIVETGYDIDPGRQIFLGAPSEAPLSVGLVCLSDIKTHQISPEIVNRYFLVWR